MNYCILFYLLRKVYLKFLEIKKSFLCVRKYSEHSGEQHILVEYALIYLYCFPQTLHILDFLTSFTLYCFLRKLFLPFNELEIFSFISFVNILLFEQLLEQYLVYFPLLNSFSVKNNEYSFPQFLQINLYSCF